MRTLAKSSGAFGDFAAARIAYCQRRRKHLHTKRKQILTDTDTDTDTYPRNAHTRTFSYVWLTASSRFSEVRIVSTRLVCVSVRWSSSADSLSTVSKDVQQHKVFDVEREGWDGASATSALVTEKKGAQEKRAADDNSYSRTSIHNKKCQIRQPHSIQKKERTFGYTPKLQAAQPTRFDSMIDYMLKTYAKQGHAHIIMQSEHEHVLPNGHKYCADYISTPKEPAAKIATENTSQPHIDKL